MSLSSSSSLLSPSYQRLLLALKQSKKTCTTVEQCCGGLISSSILAQPGASSVFYGGSVIYNTKKAKPLLLNDEALYQSLTRDHDHKSTLSKDAYIESKMNWTAQTAIQFCQSMNVDYAIAEGGAAGPTFGPSDMTAGFSVVAIAGRLRRDKTEAPVLLEQQVIHAPVGAGRYANMQRFAKAAADLATATILKLEEGMSPIPTEQDEPQPMSIAVNRATHLRTNADALQELKPQAQYILLERNKILVDQNDNTKLKRFSWNELQQATVCGRNHRVDTQISFLGLIASEQNQPCFGVDLLLDSDATKNTWSPPEGSCFVYTRTQAPLFDPLSNELALHATALAQWQRQTKYCSVCGHATEFVQAGTCSQCMGCKHKTWPRQDPSMIAIVTSRDGERVLLARSPRHPPKMHTVLAGFVEAGETLEHAVAREVLEETGILIDQGSVHYVGSQPWPFPQSFMLGFSATASDKAPITIDGVEILSAQWFEKAQVQRAAQVPGATMQVAVAQKALEQDPSIDLLIPPRGVIARKLIDQWLESN